jgi:transposase-like protein
VQLRFKTSLTSKEYVSRKAWRAATLERCPIHTHGKCSFSRHGTYVRVNPPSTQIPRWYCPQAHRTFSLLPDYLAARLSGSLREVESVVVEVEQTKSLETAADQLRLDIELPGAIRWTRRRVKYVQASLTVLLGLLPELFAGCQPTLTAFCHWLRVDVVLPALREIAALHLGFLPPPLGFRPPCGLGGEPKRGDQHRMGPDPPPSLQ